MQKKQFIPVLIWGIVSSFAMMSESRAAGKDIPTFADIEKTVLEYFEDQDDYKPGDLITRKQVEPLLKTLKNMGLPLRDEEEILDAVPGNNSFIVQQLSTPTGRKFMRRIARFPDAYDRVDRLSHLPRGRQTVRDLIREPGGYKMIEYMTTVAGGKELGKMLSNSPNGKNFNKPTGRIYTVNILLERLATSREESVKATKKQGNPGAP